MGLNLFAHRTLADILEARALDLCDIKYTNLTLTLFKQFVKIFIDSSLIIKEKLQQIYKKKPTINNWFLMRQRKSCIPHLRFLTEF